MCCVRPYETNEVDEKRNLNGLSLFSIVAAAYLFIIIIIKQAVTISLVGQIVIFSVLVILLASPLYVAVKPQSTQKFEETDTDTDQLLNNTSSNQDILEEHNKNLLQAICTVDFWCLFLTTVTGMGTGLATANNLAQVGESLGYTSFETSTLVSLWSIWNFVGRFGSGYVSDYFVYEKKWARPVFIAITLALMSVGHCVIASGFPGALYVGSVLVGVFYGSQWSLMPTIASEVFGVFHFGTIFNTITIAGPIGSYVVSVRVIGYIYDREAAQGGTDTDYCTGTHCFRLSFLIMAFSTFLGFMVAMGLFIRTRRFYERIVLKRDGGCS